MSKIRFINWPNVASSVVGSAIAASVLGGVAFFLDEMFQWFKENKIKSKSKEYYEEMLKAHPELKKEDPVVVARYWASLYHFAPYMAQDPLSAGAFIRQSIARGYPEQYGGPPIDAYNTLSGINKSFLDTKSKRRFSEVSDSAVSKVIATGALRAVDVGRLPLSNQEVIPFND